MSNLPEITPVCDKNGICYIVVTTPEFPRVFDAAGDCGVGAWWQLINAMNGKVVTYGFADRLGGCMARATTAGKKAAKYRIKKREDSYRFLQRAGLE